MQDHPKPSSKHFTNSVSEHCSSQFFTRLKNAKQEKRRTTVQILCDAVDSNPLMFLEKLREEFSREFQMTISISTKYKILIHD